MAAVSGDGSRWFRVYWSKDWDLTASFIRRAEASGYSDRVVTLDTQTLIWRPRDLTNAHLPFMKGQGLANYLSDPVFLAGLPCKPEDDVTAAVNRCLELFSDLSRTWKDLARLKGLTKLPLILKGIQHPDDARLAIDSGADAVWVSNHGGRQLVGAIGMLAMSHALESMRWSPRSARNPTAATRTN